MREIGDFDEYNQWREAKRGIEAKLSGLPKGFEVELIRTAEPNEGSWVSMEFDSEGRLIIAREKQGILRFALNQGAVSRVEVINGALRECRGLLWAHGSLYANANNSKGLYRLRDTTGDDQFDEVRLLRETEGGVGHGRNDLALGPDGLIYSIQGDSVKVPTDATWFSKPQIGAPSPKGYVARTDKNGKGWEVVCSGLRNPYGIDFSPEGEMFTYDADNEGDIGLPLYRPTRVNHLVEGGNYGWLQSTNPNWSLPDYAPDTLPTTCDLGRGSPTAVKFGTRSAFPQVYKNALFALDWAYGRVIAVHLTPRGASYYATGETFMRGRPLNVTDLDFDDEGAMWLITGGRKTQSALYRIRYHGKEEALARPSCQELARLAFSASERKKFREFAAVQKSETLVGRDDRESPEARLLAFQRDPWLRYAQCVSLGRVFPNSEPAAFLGFGTDDLKEHRVQSRLEALRLAELGFGRKKLDFASWYPASDRRVNRELAKALIKGGNEDAVPITLQLAATTNNQIDRLHYLEQLSYAKVGWNDRLRKTYFRSLRHAKVIAKGDRNLPTFLSELGSRALKNLPENEAARVEYAKLLEGNVSPLATGPARAFVKEWRMEDFSKADWAKGNPKNGRSLFTAAQCNRCHQFGSLGHPVGPNLTAVGNRFSAPDLFRSMIEPSAVVADPYENVMITRKDSSVVMGQVLQDDFRTSTLHISTNPFAPTEKTEIKKSDIAKREVTAISAMPPGLLNTLSREEIADLIAFLQVGWIETE